MGRPTEFKTIDMDLDLRTDWLEASRTYKEEEIMLRPRRWLTQMVLSSEDCKRYYSEYSVKASRFSSGFEEFWMCCMSQNLGKFGSWILDGPGMNATLEVFKSVEWICTVVAMMVYSMMANIGLPKKKIFVRRNEMADFCSVLN